MNKSKFISLKNKLKIFRYFAFLSEIYVVFDITVKIKTVKSIKYELKMKN